MSTLLRAAVVVAGVVLATLAPAADVPLAGIVLVDDGGRSWNLAELRGRPVLLVVGDRRAGGQASDWGERLAARTGVLAPWQAPGKIACLAIADLRGVPEFARDAALEGVHERAASRSAAERQACSPLLLDWKGLTAERFGIARGDAAVVLVSPEHGALARASGAPTDAAVDALAKAIAGATAR